MQLKKLYLFSVVLIGISSYHSSGWSTAPPSHTATVVVHGFDSDGASQTGPFGVDEVDETVTDLAGTIGLPTAITSPNAPNQVAYCEYYGDDYPPYYSDQDKADIAAVTNQYGGGIPRYALIMAKYVKEVMRRSGARQVTLLGVSMGGLVSRWMIEKDVEGLVSSGKIARWIVIEGVIGGNWACAQGNSSIREFIREELDLNPIDLLHMSYDWIDNNLHEPHGQSSSPFVGQIPVHLWIASDDEFNDQALTIASQEPNDGVQLLRDQFFLGLAEQSKYLGKIPTRSYLHANHQSSKDHTGVRAGVAAQLTGRRRVTVTLTKARIVNDHEASSGGDGEYVFGAKVLSLQAQQQLGVTHPVNEVRHDDTNTPVHELEQGTTTTVNVAWFDDFILPGEVSLQLQTNVDELDFDPLYGIAEFSSSSSENLSDGTLSISTEQSGTYFLSTADWRGEIAVQVFDYPSFEEPPTSVSDWILYQ